MGKTLDTYFSGWEKDALAQLYFHSQVPTDLVCVNYFRYTDPDAVKSLILRRRRGTELEERDIHPERADAADTGAVMTVPRTSGSCARVTGSAGEGASGSGSALSLSARYALR